MKYLNDDLLFNEFYSLKKALKIEWTMNSDDEFHFYEEETNTFGYEEKCI